MQFEFERQYRCLECAGETILNGKIRAHSHVTQFHAHLLVSRHVDELLEELPQQCVFTFEAEPEPLTDEVFYCAYCDSFRLAENEIKGHLVSAHRTEYEGFAKIDRDYWTRREEPYLLQLDRAVKTVYSLGGVADFLTECDAE